MSPPLSLPLEPVGTRQSPEDSARASQSGSSPGWIATGIAQVVGTLIGVFVGLLAFAAALSLVLRRVGSVKLEPMIRVEVSNPSPAAYPGPRSDMARPGWDYPPSTAESTTRVADFGDQCIPFRPPGKTYDEERRAKLQQERQLEEEILKRIFEENVALRRMMCAPAGPAS